MKKKALKTLLLVIFAVVSILAFSSCGGEETTTTTGHTHVYDKEVMGPSYLKSAATCEQYAYYYKSCQCGAASPTDTFKGEDPIGHAYGSLVSNNDGTHKRVCANDPTHVVSERCSGGSADCQNRAICEKCNTAYGDVDANKHTVAGEWISAGDGTHYKVCEFGCNVRLEQTACTGGTATCSSKASCEVCHAPYGDFDPDVHTEADEWMIKIDGTHEKWCFYCQEVLESGTCVYSTATCCTRPTCGVCGGVTGNTDSENHELAAEWVSTATSHKKVHPCCEAIFIEEEEHTWNNGVCESCGYGCKHTGGEATCIDKAVCQECGLTYGELDADNHAELGEWITTATTHKHVYGCCDTVSVNETDHSWTDGVCDDCDYECQHTGGSATCTESPVCDICGEHYGNPDDNAHTEEAEWIISATKHEKKYGCCGTVIITEKAHEWENGVCVDCGYECQHTGGNATCSSAPICENCGTAYGEADESAHVYIGNECEVCHDLKVSEGLRFAEYTKYPSRNKYYAVIGRGTCTDKNVVLPMYYNGRIVDKIERDVFEDDETLESITIQGYNYVDLADCPNLKKVIIKGTNENISIGRCPALTDVVFEENATVKKAGFSSCISLKEIDFTGTGLKEIPGSGFANCIALTDINFGEDLEKIGENAFKNCFGLTKIVLPASLTDIKGNSYQYGLYNSFNNCPRLIEVENHSALELVSADFSSYTVIYNPDNGEESPFVNEDGFVYHKSAPSELWFFTDIEREGKLTVPSKFTSIRYGYTFAYCRNLTEIVIPTTVTTMGGTGMFQGCTSLESIDIPFIGYKVTATEATFAFVSMFGTNVTTNALETAENKILFANCIAIDNHGDSGSATRHFMPLSLKKVTIQDGNLFSCGAFRGCSMIEEIVFVKMNTVDVPTGSIYVRNDATQCIPSGTFFGCTSLKSITLPEDGSCEYIAGDAFTGCVSLTHLVIPEGVLTVRGGISSDCKSLVHVTLPSTLHTGYYSYEGSKNAFTGLPSLVQVCNNSTVYDDSDFPVAMNIYSSEEGENKLSMGDDGSLYMAVDGGKILIKYLGTDTEVVLDSDVKGIAPGAFREGEVTSVTLPDGITSIGAYTFYNSKLESINIPSSVATIGDYAFAGTKVTELDLSGVTAIGDYAFKDCAIEDVIFGNGLLTIGNYAFADSNIKEALIPSSVTTIGTYAFNGCNSLEKISLHFFGKHSDGSLNSGSREGTLVHIFGYYTQDIPDSLTTIILNMPTIKAWCLDGTPFEKIVVGANVTNIEACGLMNNAATVSSISFEEPADWLASDGITTVTEEQCNDGTTALYQFNKASTKYDLSWTKVADPE